MPRFRLRSAGRWAIRYQGQLADTATKLKELGLEPETTALNQVSILTRNLVAALEKLDTAHAVEHGCAAEHACHSLKAIVPAMAEVRAAADALEGIIADDLWPLPTYQEMLYIL